MTWAVEQELACPTKMVLLMLANRTNHDTGECYPSHHKLAKDCGMSLASVKRHIGELQKLGLLDVIPNVLDGCSLPNTYRLRLHGCAPTGVHSELRVGSNEAEKGVHSEPRVGSQRATNQELEPIREPVIEPRITRAHAMPDDFELTDEMMAFFLSRNPRGDAEAEFLHFTSHHRAKGSTMKDWVAAWRSWSMNCSKFNRGSANGYVHPTARVVSAAFKGVHVPDF